MMNRFLATGWFKTSEEDSFEQGCLEGGINIGGHESFTGETLEKLIKQCADFAGQSDLKNCILDSCDEIGRLDIQVYENEDGSSFILPNEWDEWKAGTRRLWLATYTFTLLQVEKVCLSRNVTDPKLYAEG